jgi:uncharacterized phage protein (TIGR01671 family)
MSRELKFRGIRIDNGEWVYGYYYAHNFLMVKDPDKHFILPKSREGCQVHPETVGQSTGLKDKNGVKIYEGDIGQSGSEELYIDVCEWEEGGRFMWVSLPDKDIVEYLDEYQVTIIGNIHQNKELLEQ